MSKTSKKSAEKSDSEMILDYYKDWDSDKAPVMMFLDDYYDFPGEIEIEDQKKMGYLRKKYQKLSK
ncbi:MAG: hypothetical protein ACFE85_13015 [Candidatus Hodarchaeota archaeon]